MIYRDVGGEIVPAPEISIFELGKMETLCQGQAEDLKAEVEGYRYWLSRCGPEDGMTKPVSVEQWNGNQWTTVHQYGTWPDWQWLKDIN